MIFVTVGTHTAPFDRLIRAMDEVARDLDEKVVMQIGHCTVSPRHAQWFRFACVREMEGYYAAARMVVCQGATSVLGALRAGTPVVAMPRMRCYGEHIDDHQIAFVRRLAELGLLTAVDDETWLRRAVADVDEATSSPLVLAPDQLVAYVHEWLGGGA